MDLREIEIAENYGEETQLRKLQEECMELIEAIEEGDPEHISEEKADVYITLDETTYLQKDGDKVRSFRDAKLNRQIGRMNNEVQHGLPALHL